MSESILREKRQLKTDVVSLESRLERVDFSIQTQRRDADDQNQLSFVSAAVDPLTDLYSPKGGISPRTAPPRHHAVTPHMAKRKQLMTREPIERQHSCTHNAISVAVNRTRSELNRALKQGSSLVKPLRISRDATPRIDESFVFSPKVSSLLKKKKAVEESIQVHCPIVNYSLDLAKISRR